MSGRGTQELAAEEPWEAEIGALLGGLPTIDPPEGFIDAAIDHRPLNAGRTLGLLGLLTVALFALVAATDAIGERTVVPPIDELVARHDLAARAGGLDPSSGDDGAEPTLAERSNPLDLPDGFEASATVDAEDIRQAIYGRGDRSVSVFVQDGRVAWSSMPQEHLTELGGLRAWVDAERRIAVLEADGATVTVIGLGPDELDETLGRVAGSSQTFWGRLSELAEAVVVPLGYTPIED